MHSRDQKLLCTFTDRPRQEARSLIRKQAIYKNLSLEDLNSPILRQISQIVSSIAAQQITPNLAESNTHSSPHGYAGQKSRHTVARVMVVSSGSPGLKSTYKPGCIPFWIMGSFSKSKSLLVDSVYYRWWLKLPVFLLVANRG